MKQVPKNLFGKFTHSLTLREFASMSLPIFPWILTRFSIFNRTLNQRARNAPVVVLKLLQYALVFTTILSLYAFGIVEIFGMITLTTPDEDISNSNLAYVFILTGTCLSTLIYLVFSLSFIPKMSRFVLITNLRTLVVSQIPFISAYKVSSLYHCEVMAVVPVIQTQNLRTPWARLKDWCLYDWT